MTNEKTPDSAASALSAGLERMLHVVARDHPVLHKKWSSLELSRINERITLAILAEREACADICDAYEPIGREGPETVAYEIGVKIRARSNVKWAAILQGFAGGLLHNQGGGA